MTLARLIVAISTFVSLSAAHATEPPRQCKLHNPDKKQAASKKTGDEPPGDSPKDKEPPCPEPPCFCEPTDCPEPPCAIVQTACLREGIATLGGCVNTKVCEPSLPTDKSTYCQKYHELQKLYGQTLKGDIVDLMAALDADTIVNSGGDSGKPDEERIDYFRKLLEKNASRDEEPHRDKVRSTLTGGAKDFKQESSSHEGSGKEMF